MLIDVPRTQGFFGGVVLEAEVTGSDTDEYHILNPRDQTTFLRVRNNGSLASITVNTPGEILTFNGAPGSGTPITPGGEVIVIQESETCWIALPSEMSQDVGNGPLDTVVFTISAGADLYLVGLGMPR